MGAQGPSLITVTESVMAIVILVIVLYVITLYFIGSVRKTMRKVPNSMLIVPTGLIWLLLVPGVSYVVSWIMLPFAMPRSIRKAVQEQGSKVWAKAVGLSRSGLALGVFSLLFIATAIWVWVLSHQNFHASNIPQHSVIASALFILFAIIQLICFIVYWRKLVAIRLDLDLAWEQRFTQAR